MDYSKDGVQFGFLRNLIHSIRFQSYTYLCIIKISDVLKPGFYSFILGHETNFLHFIFRSNVAEFIHQVNETASVVH